LNITVLETQIKRLAKIFFAREFTRKLLIRKELYKRIRREWHFHADLLKKHARVARAGRQETNDRRLLFRRALDCGAGARKQVRNRKPLAGKDFGRKSRDPANGECARLPATGGNRKSAGDKGLRRKAAHFCS
jgi:hypothetical protein